MNKYFLLFLMIFLSVSTLGISQSSEWNFNQLIILDNNNKFLGVNDLSNTSLIFNVLTSDGASLTNTDVNCTVYIYNFYNSLLQNDTLSNDANTVDKSIIFNSNIDSLGRYKYKLVCSSVNESGYIVNDFTVTRNGEEYIPELLSSNNSFLSFGFLGLGLIFLLISYLFRGEEKNVRSLRGIFFYMGIIHLLIVSLVIGSSTNCSSGLCGDINRFSGVGEGYVYIMCALLLYVLYVYGIARVTKVTEGDKK